MNETNCPLIYTQMPLVMSQIGAVGKGGWNEYDKYKFRSAEDVFNFLQRPLYENGVSLEIEVLERHETTETTQKGGNQFHVRLKVEYRFFAKDGSTMKSVVWGEGTDRSDKATNKALTAAFKYMAIQKFCIHWLVSF